MINKLTSICLVSLLMLGAAGTTYGAVASGGTITTNGAYTIHAFTNSGAFTVNPLCSLACEVLIVAGGGGGAVGGGGAGGLILTNISVSGLNIATIGAGGAGGTWGAAGNSGQDSSFSTI
ncbi:MAG: hypothetical protein KKD33_09945, partial [Verrucomicrobia bacterium]|nr:hypothetical protein [Verrucomicrobiota bacterium]